ncbi:FtsX-like permease family protein [Enterococcus crotali]|uniref:FtsX-like permease family protein n=1 Tax=Enterococcus crotali TaxID=1453587 RepID=UPI00046F533B|nr:FtsX-like permease family protein [Enterococcus crotali]
MDQFYYILKDSCTSILRKKGAALFKSSFSFLYFFILSVLLHTWITSLLLRKIEEQNRLEAIDSPDAFTQTNSSQNLVTLLDTLSIALLIFSIGLFLFGIFYLVIYLQKTLILDKKELIIKKMLGGSALQVTSEFFFEPLLLIIPSSILGLITAEYLYTIFFRHSNSWFGDVLYSSNDFAFFVDFPLIGFFSLLLIGQFLYLKQKITNL